MVDNHQSSEKVYTDGCVNLREFSNFSRDVSLLFNLHVAPRNLAFLNLEGSMRKLIVKDPGDRQLGATVCLIVSPLLRQVENLEEAIA